MYKLCLLLSHNACCVRFSYSVINCYLHITDSFNKQELERLSVETMTNRAVTLCVCRDNHESGGFLPEMEFSWCSNCGCDQGRFPGGSLSIWHLSDTFCGMHVSFRHCFWNKIQLFIEEIPLIILPCNLSDSGFKTGEILPNDQNPVIIINNNWCKTYWNNSWNKFQSFNNSFSVFISPADHYENGNLSLRIKRL